jgi:hypothetical protein
MLPELIRGASEPGHTASSSAPAFVGKALPDEAIELT